MWRRSRTRARRAAGGSSQTAVQSGSVWLRGFQAPLQTRIASLCSWCTWIHSFWGGSNGWLPAGLAPSSGARTWLPTGWSEKTTNATASSSHTTYYTIPSRSHSSARRVSSSLDHPPPFPPSLHHHHPFSAASTSTPECSCLPEWCGVFTFTSTRIPSLHTGPHASPGESITNTPSNNNRSLHHFASSPAY